MWIVLAREAVKLEAESVVNLEFRGLTVDHGHGLTELYDHDHDHDQEQEQENECKR